MDLNRREFLAIAAGGVAASGVLSQLSAQTAAPPRIKAVAFDAFAILDPRPVTALAEALFPGKGAELSNTWRTRQFEYQWLRTLSGHYADFWRATEDGLVFAAKSLQLELTPDKRTQLMQAYLGLKAWPDAPAALRSLKEAGLRLAFLSNLTAKILDAGIKNAGLEGMLDHVLSADRVKVSKPDPRAYHLAMDAFKLERGEILYTAFAGWDAAGAKWFGYPTFWANRHNAPAEELGVAPDAMGRDLTELVTFVKAAR
jgi:2-haloacid dehalogenase